MRKTGHKFNAQNAQKVWFCPNVVVVVVVVVFTISYYLRCICKDFVMKHLKRKLLD
jgi:hypothetical protein